MQNHGGWRDSQSALRARGGINILAVIAIAALAIAAAWWFSREPSLKANEVRVTYDNGESCIWRDWAFRVRRAVQNNRASGAMLIVGPPSIEKRDDTTLQVYSPSGQALAIAPASLREMEIVTSPDPDNASRNKVDRLTLTTADGILTFTPEELPKFSRSRVLVPVASHYFPDQSDDYMSWGNVYMTLAGTIPAECKAKDEVSLTEDKHFKKQTPAHIQFAGR